MVIRLRVHSCKKKKDYDVMTKRSAKGRCCVLDTVMCTRTMKARVVFDCRVTKQRRICMQEGYYGIAEYAWNDLCLTKDKSVRFYHTDASELISTIRGMIAR